MNIMRKGILATAAAATLAFGAAGTAQAHAFADSILNISNLRFLNSAGTQFTRGDFTTLVVENSSSATATVLPVVNFALTGPVCVGTCPGGANGPLPGTTGRFGVFPAGTLATLPNATFGFGDTSFTGSAIEAGGANASTRATASVSESPNTAAGVARVGTTSSFVFALGAADSMTVAFDADAHTVAQVPFGIPESVASASVNWSISIINLDNPDPNTNTVLSYSPNELNGDSNVARTHTAPGTTSYDFTDFLSATSAVLTAGTNYQVTIRHSSFADARQEEEVPEPATLAIVAAGLLSMSLVSRRRKS